MDVLGLSIAVDAESPQPPRTPDSVRYSDLEVDGPPAPTCHITYARALSPLTDLSDTEMAEEPTPHAQSEDELEVASSTDEEFVPPDEEEESSSGEESSEEESAGGGASRGKTLVVEDEEEDEEERPRKKARMMSPPRGATARIHTLEGAEAIVWVSAVLGSVVSSYSPGFRSARDASRLRRERTRSAGCTSTRAPTRLPRASAVARRSSSARGRSGQSWRPRSGRTRRSEHSRTRPLAAQRSPCCARS